jgi:hypothetical protein
MARISDDLAAKLLAHRERKAAVKAARGKGRTRPAPVLPTSVEPEAPARANWFSLLQPMTLSCDKK